MKTRLEELNDLQIEQCSDLKIYESILNWANDPNGKFANIMKVINQRIQIEVERAFIEKDIKEEKHD